MNKIYAVLIYCRFVPRIRKMLNTLLSNIKGICPKYQHRRPFCGM